MTPPEGDQIDVGPVRPLMVPGVDPQCRYGKPGRTATYRLGLAVKVLLRSYGWEILTYQQELHAKTPVIEPKDWGML